MAEQKPSLTAECGTDLTARATTRTTGAETKNDAQLTEINRTASSLNETRNVKATGKTHSCVFHESDAVESNEHLLTHPF